MATDGCDAILRHMLAKGVQEPAPAELMGDIEEVAARYERFVSRPGCAGLVEISPYFEALLQASGYRLQDGVIRSARNSPEWNAARRSENLAMHRAFI